VRLLVTWQLTKVNGRMQCGSVPLSGLWPDEFIFFTFYALTRLALQFPSFFFTLLENYDL
jgi:hypothetical protein